MSEKIPNLNFAKNELFRHFEENKNYDSINASFLKIKTKHFAHTYQMLSQKFQNALTKIPNIFNRTIEYLNCPWDTEVLNLPDSIK